MAYGKIKADSIIYDNSGSDVEKTIASLASAAPLGSPTFTGTVTIPTPSAGDNSTKAASTAYVVNEFAPKASPTFTGTINGAALTLSGNLTVNGTTTTVNTATLEVEDKNIELGKVSTPTDSTADGGGITLKGATDKTINWINSTDNWTFNQNIEVTGTASAITITAGEGNNSSLYLIADDGDDNGDYWCIYSAAGDNDLYFKTKTSGSYVTAAKVTEEGEVHDAIGDLRAIPANATTSAYTLVASDRGKTVTNTTGGVTIPYNVFAAGDAVTIVNHSGSAITLTQGSNMTLYNSADAATGNRTLAARGMATVWYQAQNYAYISGSGLT